MLRPLMQGIGSRHSVPMYAVRKAAVSQRCWTVITSMTKAAVIKKRRTAAMSVKSVMARSRRIPGRIPKIREQIPPNVSVRHYARRTASTGTALCAVLMMPVS